MRIYLLYYVFLLLYMQSTQEGISLLIYISDPNYAFDC